VLNTNQQWYTHQPQTSVPSTHLPNPCAGSLTFPIPSPHTLGYRQWWSKPGSPGDIASTLGPN
jgi:hypothetical protein